MVTARLRVGVLAWSHWEHGKGAGCRFLVAGEAVTVVQIGSGSAVVRCADGRCFRVPVGFLSERTTEVVK